VAATPLQSRLLLSCAPCQIFNTWFILHLFRSPWHMEIKCLRFLWQQVGVDVPNSSSQRSSGFYGATTKWQPIWRTGPGLPSPLNSTFPYPALFAHAINAAEIFHNCRNAIRNQESGIGIRAKRRPNHVA